MLLLHLNRRIIGLFLLHLCEQHEYKYIHVSKPVHTDRLTGGHDYAHTNTPVPDGAPVHHLVETEVHTSLSLDIRMTNVLKSVIIDISKILLPMISGDNLRYSRFWQLLLTANSGTSNVVASFSTRAKTTITFPFKF